jgi:hypothetical protein
VLICGVLVGCSRTVTGGFSDSPDKSCRAYVKVYGAYGKKFVERSRKRVRITIVSGAAGENQLLRREYLLTANDLGWVAAWDSNSSVRIVFYDSKPDATNHLRTLTFVTNESGGFSESTSKRL